ncbi:MAG: rRNA cytosine-C5-methyltransferase [Tannerellaceae bacterium]|nr:rRNA cytosine-C5-methyltransferase [Tannerellaceae bacterium]
MQLPPDFISRTRMLLGEEYPRLEDALNVPSPVSIRVNLSKNLRQAGYQRVPWCDTGYYLPERLTFTFDPLFHAGAYYVQEASSMFLEQVIKTYVKGQVKCLDLCAAPGGKSTHLLSVLPENSLLVSNEVIRSRGHILSENCTKWGNPYAIVTRNDPKEIGALTHFFDVMLADVPCSGEGMFRKDVDSIGEWSVDHVALCASRQQRIVHDAWAALKPGGLFIYSTCTYNLEENEENIHHIAGELGAEVLPVPVNDSWHVTGALKYDYPVYRFFPHKTRGEGFFLAVLRKKEEGLFAKNRKQRKDKKTTHHPTPRDVFDWIRCSDCFQFETRGDFINAFPAEFFDDYKAIEQQLYMVSAGITMGEVKGKDIIPAHSLAMSNLLNQSRFNQLALSWEEAVKYLKREAIQLPSVAPKGYALTTYKGFPLGFVKQLGNRANNLYPQEWRIRTGFVPDVPVLYPL